MLYLKFSILYVVSLCFLVVVCLVVYKQLTTGKVFTQVIHTPRFHVCLLLSYGLNMIGMLSPTHTRKVTYPACRQSPLLFVNSPRASSAHAYRIRYPNWYITYVSTGICNCSRFMVYWGTLPYSPLLIITIAYRLQGLQQILTYTLTTRSVFFIRYRFENGSFIIK